MPTLMFEALPQKSLAILESKIRSEIQTSGAEVHVVIDLDNDEASQQRHCQEIQARCLDTWFEISFKATASKKTSIPYKVKAPQIILDDMPLAEFRKQQNSLAGHGAKSVISHLLLKAGAEAEIQGTALDLINQLRQWVRSHRIPAATQEGSVVIVPETIVSSELTLRSIVTLEEGRWINSEVINNYLVTHALNTGASCGHFPDPLPGVQSRVFYADTTFLPYVVVGKRKWRHNLFDYDFIVIPCHVNANHYVALVANVATFHLESWDSLGNSQDYLRQIMIGWLDNEMSNRQHHGGRQETSTWTTRAAACPLQDNGDDCGVFTLLAATYSHLGVADAYCQGDVAVVRKQLVALAVAMGNLFREGLAWAPFLRLED